MPDVTAKIAGKGTDGTGLTEDHASEMFNRIGKHWMAVVEIQAVRPHGPDIKGNRSVDLVITQIEIGDDSKIEDHLRELSRTMHQNRALHADNQQLQIQTGDDLAPKVKDIIAAGAAHVVHDFVLDDSDPDSGCLVCSNAEDDPLHTLHDELPDPDVDVDSADDELTDEDEKDLEDDALEQAEADREDAGSQETADDDPTDDADPWDDEPRADTTRPLSAVPDPFTTTN